MAVILREIKREIKECVKRENSIFGEFLFFWAKWKKKKEKKLNVIFIMDKDIKEKTQSGK